MFERVIKLIMRVYDFVIMGHRRYAYVKIDDFAWMPMSFSSVKKGDIVKLYEYDGAPVDDEKQYVVVDHPYFEGCLFPHCVLELEAI